MERPESIAIDAHGDVKVVRLIGEHDMTTAVEVRAKLDALAAEGRPVVVSLDETEFFDSSVVHALLAADRRLKERDRRLVVQAAAPAVVEGLLRPSGLADEVVWTQSLDEAIAVARQSAAA